MPRQSKTHTQFRDARTGLFITETKANRLGPDRTVKERVPNPGFGDTKPKRKK